MNLYSVKGPLLSHYVSISLSLESYNKVPHVIVLLNAHYPVVPLGLDWALGGSEGITLKKSQAVSDLVESHLN